MTIELISNESRRASGDTRPWMGTDPSLIVYPGLDICLSITCVLGKPGAATMIAGAHLMPYRGGDNTTDDIAEFAGIAKNPLSVHVVGWMGSWSGVKPSPDAAFSADTGGTLIEAICSSLKYTGTVNVIDLADVVAPHRSVDLTAKLIGSAVQFYLEGGIPIDQTPKAFQSSWMPLSRSSGSSQGCGCVVQ